MAGTTSDTSDTATAYRKNRTDICASLQIGPVDLVCADDCEDSVLVLVFGTMYQI
jgi:hypothetical protein